MIEVKVEKMVYGGEGLARHEGRAVFIPLAAPGDRLLVEITDERADFLRAEIKQIIESSAERRTPPCPYYGTCGGCQLQHLDYPAQLRAKIEFVRESLARIGGIDWPEAIEIISSEEFNYRLRAQLKAQATEDRVKLGYYRPASHELCEIDHCPLLSPALNDSLDRLRRQPAHRLAGAKTIDLAQGADGRIVTYPRNEASNTHEVSWPVGGFTYRFDAQTFFQANRFLLTDLLRLVVEGEEGERALDLFSGVGFFTIPLAHRFNSLIGVESDPRAVRFAGQNAIENQANNCRFETDLVEPWLMRNAAKLGPVDLVVVDPPRAGLSKRTVHAITRLKPSRITYVSCNPTTLARDVKWFVAEGHSISTVTALDLFPQTFHVETVVKLACG
jgi:23S rRNA (uracil1939-C5)-methyltransferase